MMLILAFMSPSEIVSLVAGIFTAVSGVSAAIACFLTYRTTRPKIKLKVGKQNSNRAYTFYKDKGFALLGIDLINSSMVAGMLDELCIIYEGKEYYAEKIGTQYDPYPFEVKSFFSEQIEQDTKLLRLKTPITVQGYSIISGYILFPSFPVVQTNTITVNISFRLMNKNFKQKIRRVKLSRVTPTPIYGSKE